jgi:hypothetical protein
MMQTGGGQVTQGTQASADRDPAFQMSTNLEIVDELGESAGWVKWWQGV